MEEKIAILVVDDEPDIRRICRILLENGGYCVYEAATGLEAVTLVRQHPEIDLILMDIMMPDLNGYDACSRIRACSTAPVLFLTARDAVSDRVKGLDSGANDYLVKPFSLEELLARVRAMTRKSFGSSSNVLAVADLELDIASKTVTRGGAQIMLSAKEYALLEYLMVNKGRILSREKIEDHIWNFDYEGGTNVVDVYISYLRKKIDDGHKKKLIHTVRGRGYVIREDDED